MLPVTASDYDSPSYGIDPTTSMVTTGPDEYPPRLPTVADRQNGMIKMNLMCETSSILPDFQTLTIIAGEMYRRKDI